MDDGEIMNWCGIKRQHFPGFQKKNRIFMKCLSLQKHCIMSEAPLIKTLEFLFSSQTFQRTSQDHVKILR